MHAPMKTAILLVLISLAIFSRFTFYVNASGQAEVITINNASADNCEPTWSRKSFNAVGLSWVFVTTWRDYGGYKEILSWSYSVDDSTFTNSVDDDGEPPLFTEDDASVDSWNYDIHYYAPYVHLVYKDYPFIKYRRGLPLVSGNITWGNLQNAYEDIDGGAGWNIAYLKLGVDTNNYVWIAFQLGNSDSFPTEYMQTWVTRSSTNDGTWVTASGFPYKLNSRADSRSGSMPNVACIPLCLGIGGETSYGDTFVLYTQFNTTTIYGKFWDSNEGWGNEETITTDYDYYNYAHVSAIGGFSHVWLAWQNSTNDFNFRIRNYATGWGDLECAANNTIEVRDDNLATPVIAIDGNASIHMFWIGRNGDNDALCWKVRNITTGEWGEYSILNAASNGVGWLIECREKALDGKIACIWYDPTGVITIEQWLLGAVTDWYDYDPPPYNPFITGWIQVGDVVDTIGLEFTLGTETYTHAHAAYILIGNYTLNATSCLDDPMHDFVSWESLAQNPIENTTNPTTTIAITLSGTVTLNVECLNKTCPHQAEGINILIRVDGQPPEHNFDGVLIDGGGYRDEDTAFLLNGTYDLIANVAARCGFSNWSTSDAGGEHWFGNKTIGGYNTTTPMNEKLGAYGTSYNLDRRATVTVIWFYCWASADVQKGTCGIYSINGHDIENAVLMGETEELTGINTTAMWRNFTFTGGLLLEAGSYALTIHAGDISAGLMGKYDAETGSHFQDSVSDTYSDGLSETFGSGGSNISNCYVSAYAEYSYDLLYVHNKTEETTYLTIYGNGTLTLNLVRLPDLTNLYTWIALFLAALFLMVWSPSWFAWKIKKVGITTESIERLGYAMLLFLVGFGLLLMCLYA